jgi:hypothetical protein
MKPFSHQILNSSVTVRRVFKFYRGSIHKKERKMSIENYKKKSSERNEIIMEIKTSPKKNHW